MCVVGSKSGLSIGQPISYTQNSINHFYMDPHEAHNSQPRIKFKFVNFKFKYTKFDSFKTGWKL